MPATELRGAFRGIDFPEFDEADRGGNGCASTAGDLAVFLQMLLNGGAYGRRRILSRASVAAMTRPQVDTTVPVIFPRIKTAGERWEDVAAGGYGYGLYIFTAGDRFRINGALVSRSGFGHSGYGGAYIWADPEQDLVGVYLRVSPRLHRDYTVVNSDLFQNAVHAAIID